jgi:hypothetical protein
MVSPVVQPDFADFIIHPVNVCLAKWPEWDKTMTRVSMLAVSVAFSVLTGSVGYWVCKAYAFWRDRHAVSIALTRSVVPASVYKVAVSTLKGQTDAKSPWDEVLGAFCYRLHYVFGTINEGTLLVNETDRRRMTGTAHDFAIRFFTEDLRHKLSHPELLRRSELYDALMEVKNVLLIRRSPEDAEALRLLGDYNMFDEVPYYKFGIEQNLALGLFIEVETMLHILDNPSDHEWSVYPLHPIALRIRALSSQRTRELWNPPPTIANKLWPVTEESHFPKDASLNDSIQGLSDLLLWLQEIQSEMSNTDKVLVDYRSEQLRMLRDILVAQRQVYGV